MSETPADHYGWAEALIARAASETEPEIKDRYIALAQVHATLATVDPAHLGQLPPPVVVNHPGWTGRIQGAEMSKGCTCPSLPGQPLARTGTDPGCPIHGETP